MLQSAIGARLADKSLLIFTKPSIHMLPGAWGACLFRLMASFTCRWPFTADHLLADGFQGRRIENLVIRELLSDVQPLAACVLKDVAITDADATERMKALLINVTVDPRYSTERHIALSCLTHT